MSRTLGAAVISSLSFHALLLILLGRFISPADVPIPVESVFRVGLAVPEAAPEAPVPSIQPDTPKSDIAGSAPAVPELPEPGPPAPESAATEPAAPEPAAPGSPAETAPAVTEPVSALGETLSLPPAADAAVAEVPDAGIYGNAVSLGDYGSAGARLTAPAYPQRARELGWEGDVTLVFAVDEKGRTDNVRILSSSGYELLDETALKTVEKAWRFPKGFPAEAVWKTFSFRLN